jgi:heme/copper-type cytochrome/quinol oxidase subunit 2
MYRRTAVAILVCFNIALGILVLYFLARGYQPPPKEAQTIEYKDFISILLTGLAVMIAVGTIMIAAAAVWGFEAIRREAKASAEVEARKTATTVATAVATRTARETLPSDTSATEAEALVDALAEEEATNDVH